VLSIEPRCFGGTQEELRSIGVWSGIGHRQNSRSGVSELKVLICELGSENRLSTGSVVVGEITSLAHESRNDTVEAGISVSESLLSGAQSALNA